MLTRASRVAEPGIVGDIHHPVRTIRFVDDLMRKNRLVADQDTDRRHPRNMQSPRSRPTREAATRNNLEILRHPVRLILAEWDQVPFIVDRLNLTARPKSKQAVPRPVGFIEPNRTDQRGRTVGGLGDKLPRRPSSPTA